MKPLNIFQILILASLIYCCSNDSIKTNTSSDIFELKKYINLDKYEPIQAIWSYKKIVNHTKTINLDIENYKLEALLKFDKKTINSIKENYRILSVSLLDLKKESFRFEWLDKKYLNILNTKNSIIYYHPHFFKKGQLKHGGFIIIDECTVLLSLHTI